MLREEVVAHLLVAAPSFPRLSTDYQQLMYSMLRLVHVKDLVEGGVHLVRLVGPVGAGEERWTR